MSFKYSFNSYLMLSFGVDTYTSHFYFLCKAKELSCWIVSQVDDGECGIASGFGCGGRCGTRKLQFKLRLLVTILGKNLLHLSDFFFFFSGKKHFNTLYINYHLLPGWIFWENLGKFIGFHGMMQLVYIKPAKKFGKTHQQNLSLAYLLTRGYPPSNELAVKYVHGHHLKRSVFAFWHTHSNWAWMAATSAS